MPAQAGPHLHPDLERPQGHTEPRKFRLELVALARDLRHASGATAEDIFLLLIADA
jgi:hypothetical protein